MLKLYTDPAKYRDVLTSVLNGQTYQQIGNRYIVSKSTINQLFNDIIRAMRHDYGVPGDICRPANRMELTTEEFPFGTSVYELRKHRDRILQIFEFQVGTRQAAKPLTKNDRDYAVTGRVEGFVDLQCPSCLGEYRYFKGCPMICRVCLRSAQLLTGLI